MKTRNRFTALLLTAAFAQLSLGATPVCGSHDDRAAMSDMATMDHASVPLPMDANPADAAQCDARGTPADQQPPCDHEGMAETCTSMSSCTSVSAEVQARQASVATHARRGITSTERALHGAVIAPEPPPPRA